jgi:hypothetical protein
MHKRLFLLPFFWLHLHHFIKLGVLSPFLMMWSSHHGNLKMLDLFNIVKKNLNLDQDLVGEILEL